LRSLLTNVLLMTILVLASGQVDGQDASPDPVDLTYLSMEQLMAIEVALPVMDESPSSVAPPSFAGASAFANLDVVESDERTVVVLLQDDVPALMAAGGVDHIADHHAVD
jgi:hypothetical protein